MRLERYYRVKYVSSDEKEQLLYLPAFDEEDAKEKTTWWVSDYKSFVSLEEIPVKTYLDSFN